MKPETDHSTTDEKAIGANVALVSQEESNAVHAEVASEANGEEMISRYWPAFAIKDMVVASTLTIIVVLLAIFLVPQQIVTDPIYRTPVPSPDWLYLFYLLPFIYLQGSIQLPALLTIPPLAILLLVLVPFVQRTGAHFVGRRARKVLVLAVVTILIAVVVTTTAYTGSRVPSQGCAACHRPRMVGDPPTELKGLAHRDSQWIARHLIDPQYWWMQ